jgi:hypothetical protein
LGPLVMRGRRLNRMECLGVDELYEPTDFPHSDPVSLACLVKTLVELKRPLLMRRILADSPVLNALRKACCSRDPSPAIRGSRWTPPGWSPKRS